MELFEEIVNDFQLVVNGFQPFTIIAKSSFLDVWEVSEYTSGSYKFFNMHNKI